MKKVLAGRTLQSGLARNRNPNPSPPLASEPCLMHDGTTLAILARNYRGREVRRAWWVKSRQTRAMGYS